MIFFIVGLRVVFNVTNAPGSRVISADVLCRKCDIPKYEPLDESKDYRMVVPSFINDGGNGFYTFKKKKNFKKGDKKDIDAIGDYLKKLSPAYQKADKRIRVVT